MNHHIPEDSLSKSLRVRIKEKKSESSDSDFLFEVPSRFELLYTVLQTVA